MINNAYMKYYNPSEHLAADKIIVHFKRESSFQAVHLKKTQTFGIKFSNCVIQLGTLMT
jgi:hypothetical protein